MKSHSRSKFTTELSLLILIHVLIGGLVLYGAHAFNSIMVDIAELVGQHKATTNPTSAETFIYLALVYVLSSPVASLLSRFTGEVWLFRLKRLFLSVIPMDRSTSTSKVIPLVNNSAEHITTQLRMLTSVHLATLSMAFIAMLEIYKSSPLLFGFILLVVLIAVPIGMVSFRQNHAAEGDYLAAYNAYFARLQQHSVFNSSLQGLKLFSWASQELDHLNNTVGQKIVAAGLSGYKARLKNILIFSLVEIFLLAGGTMFFFSGRVELSVVVLVILYSITLLPRIQKLYDSIPDIASLTGSIGSLQAFLKSQEEQVASLDSKESHLSVQLDSAHEGLKLNVQGQDILLKPGIHLVSGPSGSGKSMFFDQLARKLAALWPAGTGGGFFYLHQSEVLDFGSLTLPELLKIEFPDHPQHLQAFQETVSRAGWLSPSEKTALIEHTQHPLSSLGKSAKLALLSVLLLEHNSKVIIVDEFFSELFNENLFLEQLQHRALTTHAVVLYTTHRPTSAPLTGVLHMNNRKITHEIH